MRTLPIPVDDSAPAFVAPFHSPIETVGDLMSILSSLDPDMRLTVLSCSATLDQKALTEETPLDCYLPIDCEQSDWASHPIWEFVPSVFLTLDGELTRTSALVIPRNMFTTHESQPHGNPIFADELTVDVSQEDYEDERDDEEKDYGYEQPADDTPEGPIN